MLRESHTIIVERNWTWRDEFQTEPSEVAWATEAIYFVRALDADNLSSAVSVRVQISPDGMHWCDEGSVLTLPLVTGDVTCVRITHFGGWLRLAGEIPNGEELTVIVYLTLKA